MTCSIVRICTCTRTYYYMLHILHICMLQRQVVSQENIKVVKKEIAFLVSL